MTIRVVLAAQADEALPQPPGRILLAHADHAFSDLAEAIDAALGRWDLTPVHQFEVEGRVLLSPEAAAEDPEVEASDEVTVGEVGLRAGARFTYTFDLGEQWLHECAVEEVGVDPFEVAGEEADVPVPVFGWGTIPDQYGRLTEEEDDWEDGGDGDDAWDEPGGAGEDWDEDGAGDEDDEDVGGWDDDEDDDDEDEDEDPDGAWDDDEDDDEDDDAAATWAVVREALAGVERPLDEGELHAAAARLRGDAGDGDAWTWQALWSAAGLAPGRAPSDDRELWLALAAGMVAPQGDGHADPRLRRAWEALEPADWAGAVIELVRAGAGAQVTPERALALIARCPEVEEEDLTAEGERAVLEGLDVAVQLWRTLGAIDGDGRLSRLGVWGLPEALQRAWVGDES